MKTDFQGELSLFEEDADGRRAKRREVAFAADLRRRGTSAIPIRVLDISSSGFRGETHLDFHVGQTVWLRLPGLEAYHATVVWADGIKFGCAFERALHPAVVDLLVMKARGRR